MLPFARRCSVGWTLTRSPRENRSDPQDGQADELAPPGAPSRPMSAKSRQGKKCGSPQEGPKLGEKWSKLGKDWRDLVINSTPRCFGVIAPSFCRLLWGAGRSGLGRPGVPRKCVVTEIRRGKFHELDTVQS